MPTLRAEPIQSSTQTLGPFLRSHRERLSPTKLGLAFAGRRRTPGLRREEVAQLCAVSTTWYTWLEQGRPVRASPSVLKRIAEALQLSRAERLYLFEIARCVVPDSSEAHQLEIPTGLKDLVDQMPVPVYVPGIGALRSSSGRGCLHRKNAISFVLSFWIGMLAL
jgi:transcriptional regulator with XRE-family HTH domain